MGSVRGEKGKTMSEYIVRETGYPGTLKQEIVGELVRCKDCVHCRKGFNLENEPYYYCRDWDAGVEEDSFCSDAERRTDE